MTTSLRPYWSEASGDHASVVQTVPDMLELVPDGTSKGNGVKLLLDHLGVTSNEVRHHLSLLVCTIPSLYKFLRDL